MNIFPDFKQNDIEINAVRHLCFGSTGLSHVFFEKLSESTKTEILKYLRSHQLPSEYIPNDIFPTQKHLRWCIKCFEKDNEKSESEKDFENNLILYELLRTKTKQTINFYKALAAINETFNPQNFANLITSFFDFYHFNKSFATVFIPVVSKFAEKAGFSQVSNSFGKESLVLFHSGTLLDLTFSFQTQEDFEYVFQFPNLPNEVLVFFQTCFISDNAFPLTSFVSQTPMLSALNTCATTSAHFVEIISSLAESQFRARDYENCWKTCLTSEELAPWVFISLCKENNICESVKTFNSLKGDSIAYDLLRRAMADNHICEKYKHMTGNTLKPSALVTRSIPSLLEVSLDSFMTNDFNEMFNTQLFSIRDEDLSIDNDFVCYYFALGFTVKLLNNEISIDESSQIELFIANIRNDENRQKCLIDIFSLMFLQDKNKAFLCSLNSAECISMIILNSTDNQNLLNYVQIGHSRIQTEQFISEGGLLSKCFVNKMTQVNNALIIGDYQIAEHVAGHDMKLRAMIDAHRSVQNFRKQRMNGFDGKGLPAVEVGLSFEDEVISLQKSDGVPLCDECKQIIEKRIRMKGVNQLGITSRTDMQEFSQITQKLVRTSSVSWTTPSYSDTSAKLLYGFFSYLDSIIPPLLEAHIGQTVFDCLRVDRMYMIDKLLRSNKVIEARRIADLLKVDIVNFIFRRNDLSYETIEEFTDNSIPTINAYAVTSNWQESELSHTSNVVRKFIKRSRETKKISASEMKEEDFLDSITEFSQEELTKILIELIERKQFDKKELFEEISYILKDFSTIIWENINDLNFESICNVMETCCISEDLFEKLSALKGIKKPFPLEETVKELLISSNFGKVLTILKTFPDVYKTVVQYSRIAPQEFFDVFVQFQKPEEHKITEDLEKPKESVIKERSDPFKLQRTQFTIQAFASSMKTLAKTFDDQDLMFDFLVGETTRRLKISKSLEDCSKGLAIISQLLQQHSTQNELSKKLIALDNFLQQHIDDRFKFNIGLFSNFETADFGHILMNACIDFDLPNTKEISENWEISTDEFRPKIFNELVSMSFFEESLTYIDDYEDAVIKYSRPQIYNKNNIENVIPLLRYISFKGYTLTNEQQEIIDNILQTRCEASFRIKYCIQNNKVEEAYKVLQSSEQGHNEEYTKKLLIQSFLSPCVSYCRLEGMKRILMGNGSNGRAQLTQILAYASENKLLHLKLDIEQLLGLNKDAAFTSISLFCDRGFGQQNFGYLDTAQAVLMREPGVNQDKDTKDLIESIKYQRLFSVFLTEHNLIGFTELNIFESPQSRKSIVVLLFKSFSIDLAIDIMNHYSMNVRAVSRSLADALINEETTINNFFIKLQSKKIFREMSFVILTRAWFIFSEKEKVLFIVKNIIQDMEYKCLLLLEFNRLELALDTAKKCGMTAIYPLIAKQSFNEGNLALYNKAIKLMQI